MAVRDGVQNGERGTGSRARLVYIAGGVGTIVPSLWAARAVSIQGDYPPLEKNTHQIMDVI